MHKSAVRVQGLSDDELEVLRLLWRDSPQKPADLQRAFVRDIDNGTLRSLLVSMMERGLLRRDKQGKAYFYSPRIRRETLLRRMTRQLADVFAGGSTRELLMQLVEDERLTADEIERLREIAGDRDKPETGS